MTFEKEFLEQNSKSSETDSGELKFIRLFSKFGKELKSTRNIKDVSNAVLQAINDIGSVEVGLFFQINQDDRQFQLIGEFGLPDLNEVARSIISPQSSLCKEIQANNSIHCQFSEFAYKDDLCADLQDLRALAIYPILIEGEVSSFVLLGSRAIATFAETKLEAYKTICELAGFCLTKQSVFATHKDREALYRTFIDQSIDILVMIDSEGIQRFVSSSAKVILGLDAEYLIDKPALTFVHPDDASLISKELDFMKSNPGVLRTAEYRHITGNGGWLYLEGMGVGRRNAEGEVEIIVNTRDIGARRQAQIDLQEQRLLFQNVIDSSFDAIYIIRNDGYQYVNPAFCELTGYTVEELTAKDFDYQCTLTKETREISNQRYLDRKAGKEVSNRYVISIIRKNGEIRDIELSTTMLPDPEDVTVLGYMRDITESKKVEDALREKDERVQVSLEGSNIGLWDWDVTSGEVHRIRPWASILGYCPSEFETTAQAWEENLHRDDKIKSLTRLHDHLEGKTEEYESEQRLRAKNGEWRWMLDRGRVISRGEDGRPLRMVGVYLDITAQKMAEMELQVAHDLLEQRVKDRTVELESVNISLQVQSRNLAERVKELRCLTEVSKISSDHRRPIKEVVPEVVELLRDGMQYPEKSFVRIEFEGSSYKSSNWVECKSKITSQLFENFEKVGLVEVGHGGERGNPFLTEEYNLVHSIGRIVSDFISRHRTEQKLHDHYNRFFAILESFPEIIYVSDTDTYEVLFTNKVFDKILQDDPIGKKCYSAFYGFDKPCDFCTNKTILENPGELYVWENTNRHVNKDYLITDQIIEWPDSRKVRLEIAIDITNQKRLERSLISVNEELKRSNSDLEQFAYVASHDLQEPLRKIRAFGDRLEYGYSDILGDKGLDYLNRMLGASKRMQILINDLLTFSRVTSRAKPFELIDMNKVIQEVLSDLEVRIQETNSEIIVDDLPKLEADATQIRLVMQNFLSNALKFIKEDRKPIIEIKSVGLNRNYKPTKGKMLPRFYQISVKDNGIGFEKRFEDRIFKIFQRLHSRTAFDGSGIGLAVCRKIVDRHKGKILTESEPEKGSTFHVILPAKQKKEIQLNE